MSLADKVLEDHNPLNLLNILYFIILIVGSIFVLQSLFLALFLFHLLIADLYEREDFNEGNWYEEDDINPDFFDEEEQVEGYLDEMIDEEIMEYSTSEFIEYWSAYNSLIPSDFFFVNLNNNFKNLDIFFNELDNTELNNTHKFKY